MPNSLFPKYRQAALEGTIAYLTDNIKAVLVDLNTYGLAISSSTNATPPVITTAAHGYTSGDQVIIGQHLVNTAANNIATGTKFYITVLSTTTFSLYTDVARTAACRQRRRRGDRVRRQHHQGPVPLRHRRRRPRRHQRQPRLQDLEPGGRLLRGRRRRRLHLDGGHRRGLGVRRRLQGHRHRLHLAADLHHRPGDQPPRHAQRRRHHRHAG
jgi:hypothetical protein